MGLTEDLGCLPVTALNWPVTYTYHLQTPFGGSQQRLTVDLPLNQFNFDSTVRYGALLWQLAVARATSVSTVLTATTVTAWRTGEGALVPPEFFTTGTHPSLSGSRSETAGLVIHTGGHDRLSLRRFPIVGTPRQWVTDGMLTSTARRTLEQTAQAWKMGMAWELPPFYVRWLQVYTDYDAGPELGVMSLGFRIVQAVRVLHYTMRAPEPALV